MKTILERIQRRYFLVLRNNFVIPNQINFKVRILSHVNLYLYLEAVIPYFCYYTGLNLINKISHVTE